MAQCTVSSHVLNTVTGKGGLGMQITLEEEHGEGSYRALHRGVADANGRVPGNEFPKIEAGRTYRMSFNTKAYFEQEGVAQYFFPVVRIEFSTQAAGHYHIPLILSPYGYSTYRGNVRRHAGAPSCSARLLTLSIPVTSTPNQQYTRFYGNFFLAIVLLYSSDCFTFDAA